MNNRRDGYEIWQALSRFSPDIFAHPVWVQFITSNTPVPEPLTQDLQAQSQQLVTQGDIRGACQVLLICAALNKRREKYEASLDCLQRAWELADSNKLPDIIEWAAWGSSGVHILLGQPDQAVNSLRWLNSQLGSKGDWVLANLVELFATELSERTKGRRTIEIPLDWLLKWGETPESMNGARPNRSSSKSASLRTVREAVFSFLARILWPPVKVGLIENHKRAQAESSLKASSNMPLPIQSNHPHDAQLPHIGGNDGLLERKSTQFERGSSPASSPIVAVENSLEVLPAKKEGSRIYLAVYSLGQFRVSLNDQWIASWPSGKGKAILKFMVINYPRSISKEVLMDNLWRDVDPVSARNSLYVAIYGLRQAFKTLLPGFNPVLFEDDRYCLNPAMSVWLDVEEFLRLYQTGQELEQSGRLEETIQAYESAANLYQGDFLADDLYEEWPVLTRERLRMAYLDTLDRLSRIHFNQGQYLACINLCHLTLTRDNCREDTHRRLMRCYSRQGQHQLALSQFQVCVDTLRSELGVDPEQVTMQLVERIRRRENV